MDAQELAKRAHYARRLKAAKWLAGSVKFAPGRDGKGKKKGLRPISIAEITQKDLADRLAAHKIKASWIGSIERMERDTQLYELEPVRKALDLPEGWFDFSPVDDLEPFERVLREATQAARELGLAPEEEGEDDDEQDHPGQGRGDAGA